MRRTIATMVLLAGWASASMANATEEPEAATEVASPVAQYHLGDNEESDASTASSSKASTKKAVYAETQTKEPVALAALEVSAGEGMSCCKPSCNSCCGSCSNSCCCNNWFCNSVRVEALGWFTSPRDVPPLVTTSPDGTLRGEAGVLGFPNTTVLYGADEIGDDIRGGARISVSHMLADECTWVDGRFWGLEDGSERFAADSTGSPILAIPFFDALLNVESAQLLAFPAVATNGSVLVESRNDLYGFDFNLRRTWRQGCRSHIDLLGGYLFTRMDDSLFLNAEFTSLEVPTVGTVTNFRDSFRAKNEFHGAQIGFLARSCRDNLSLEFLGKIAFGNMREDVVISGFTTSTPAGGAAIQADGGLFTQPSNIGTYSRDEFCVVPEMNVTLAYQINCNWKATVGYTFIYLSDVALAGDQIDRRVNQAQLTTPPDLPAFPSNGTDFWAMGFNLGVQYEW